MIARFRIRRPLAAPRVYEFDPPSRDAGSSMASGVFNSTAGQIVKVLCQVASVLLLSRMLAPSDFGLIAMASPVYGFIYLFQELGLGLATVQRPRITHEQISFFFWINVAVGLVLSGILIAISPLVAHAYHEPRLAPLVAAMSVLLMISALGVQSGAVLMRRMKFRILAINGGVGAVAGLVTALAAAEFIGNHWALYIGMLAGTAAPALGAVLAARWAPSRPRIPKGARSMLQFGGGVTLSNISHFIARNADNILIGWRWGESPLGLYDRAYKLLLFPLQFIVGPTMYSMAPILSRLDQDPEEYRRIFLNAVALLILVVWPGILWAMVFNADLVPLLLGDQWSKVSPIFAALAIAGLLQVLNGAPVPLFVSQGRTGDLARWALFHAATCVAAFMIGLPFGVVAVATAYAASECLRTPLLWLYATRRGPVTLGAVVRRVWPHLIAAVVVGTALTGLRTYVPLPGTTLLVVALFTSYGLTLGVVALFGGGRETLGTATAFARDTLARRRARLA